MATAAPIDSSRIRPGQYSRQHSAFSSSDLHGGKENEPLSPQHERGRSAAIPIDPKYRLRGNSPEDADRASRSSKFGSSFSPKKGLRSRSRSRSRLFGKDKTDTLNSQSASAQPAAVARTPEQIDADFLDLLDELQVQPDRRRKLLSLNSTVKASMLQGQASLSLAAFGLDDNSSSMSSSPTKSARMPIPELLKGRPASRPASTVYAASPLLDDANSLNRSSDSAELMAPPDTAQLFGCGPPRQVSSGSMDSGSSGSGHAKQPSNTSRSALRDAFKKSTPNLGQGGSLISLAASAAGGSGSVASSARPRSMSFGKDVAASLGKETPESFATMLKCTDASRIDVARVKRMRAVLAAESPAWISAFIGGECGGYEAMLTRLDELLAMEWRDEQHDDMLLHELLRCFVVLSTTEVGRAALASQAPRPFRPLVELLFSDKKPGDLATRKLMVDMLAILLDLQLPAHQAHAHSSLNYLLALLHNPADPARDSVVDFIKQTHTLRPFKTYVLEVSCVCRDYFWIFCHSQNLFWRFDELHDRIDAIRGPKVPSGMTGGVEFEAMAYVTAHLRLVNAIASVLVQTKPHQLPRPAMSALEFHESLFASGVERVLATLRRASQRHYPTTHLEVARYMCLARQAGYALPYHLTDWIEGSRLECAPLLPPLQLPPIPTAGAAAGYGLAGAFITPSTPVRQSSFEPTANDASGAGPRSPPAATAGATTMTRSNAMRTASQSPTKPHDDNWDFTTERHVEVVGFDRRLDSQFSLSEPPVGMPSSSTSRRICGLDEAVSHHLAPNVGGEDGKGSMAPSATQQNVAGGKGNAARAAGASVVGSAVKKWESMSVSHHHR
ncbi:uncharacterized protein SRS1_12194 [Sporisorium reilianum f. sp. reilianum]|uniref:Formin GTPase-binding domain-containing protein n=1 Tax=Sporisorium reilianum f. sp. reilianum TaxID=72559 RepID=A0A2N8U7G8_9BASI|nr:uncharacterized protein SRS1_12194 [Sporisorium reilianum f. sp. reilianum]